MARFLEIDDRGTAVHEYFASGPRQLPDGSLRRMVDVTDRPQVRAGYVYDAALDAFTAPVMPDNLGPVDARTFQFLFTAAERKAIRAAAKTNPDVEDWARLAEVPLPIRLRHPDTQAGLQFIVSQGLLAPERVEQITGGVKPQTR